VIDWIVCAHNESATIDGVVRAIVRARLGPVLVVADRCTDNTAFLAHQAGAAVLTANAGEKGTAMALGLMQTEADRVGFIDADLVGLRPDHLMLLSAWSDAMVVGLRDSTQRLAGFPPIGGERVLPCEIALRAGLQGSAYKAEMRLAAAAKRLGYPTVEVELRGLQHPTRLQPARVASRWHGVWRGYREYQAAERWRSSSSRNPPYAAQSWR
jgi:hypothetical protein